MRSDSKIQFQVADALCLTRSCEGAVQMLEEYQDTHVRER